MLGFGWVRIVLVSSHLVLLRPGVQVLVQAMKVLEEREGAVLSESF